jgi:hypothetical protein
MSHPGLFLVALSLLFTLCIFFLDDMAVEKKNKTKYPEAIPPTSWTDHDERRRFIFNEEQDPKPHAIQSGGSNRQDLITIPFDEYHFTEEREGSDTVIHRYVYGRTSVIEASPESSYLDVKNSIKQYLFPWSELGMMRIYLYTNDDGKRSPLKSEEPFEPDDTATALSLFGKEGNRLNLRVYYNPHASGEDMMILDIGVFIPIVVSHDDDALLSRLQATGDISFYFNGQQQHIGYSSSQSILKLNRMLSSGQIETEIETNRESERESNRDRAIPTFIYHQYVESLKPELLQSMKTYIEDLYTSAMTSNESLPFQPHAMQRKDKDTSEMQRDDDFKVYLTSQQLQDLIGLNAIQVLESYLSQSISEMGLANKTNTSAASWTSHLQIDGKDRDINIESNSDYEIILRRCAARDQFIPFHFDRSALLTLQVTLNDERDYEGGRLIYLTERVDDGEEEAETGGHAGRRVVWSQPHRNAGSILIHGNNILHGVSKMGSGVRYALFLLYKPQLHSVAVDGVVSG